jgi:hypothetical protein
MKNPKIKVQKEREVRRYSLLNVGSSIMDAINLEHGLLYTIKEFLLRPGQSTRAYLGEGRLNYFSPFRMLLLSTALLLILIQSVELDQEFEKSFLQGANATAEAMNDTDSEKAMKAKELSLNIMSLIQEYFNVFIWLYIPVISLFTWLFNRKSGLNYAENIVFNTCYTSIVNLFAFIFLLGYLVDLGGFGTLIYTLLSLVYFVWYYQDLFGKSLIRSVFEGIIMSMVSAFIYSFALGIIFGMALAKGWITV